ncbi:MAG: carboxypeptidase regulatory-like domain-containing protein [Cytophagaceae bacterium]
MRHLLITLFGFFLISSALAQAPLTGTITGIIKDSTGEEMIGALVKVVETPSIGASTQLQGDFMIKIKPGTYTLQIEYIGYRTKTVPNVVVRENETTKLNILLDFDNTKEIASVVVVGTRPTNTVTAVVQEVKNSEQVVNGISEETINQSQATDAGKVAATIPGVTLMENRFVMVRGLSQRYNNVMINGAYAPSTEPDERAFSFDLIPSNMLDRMLIYKSGAPELPGDFAGGAIKIFTKTNVREDFLQVGLGLGYRTATTFTTRQYNPGSSTDFLGIDGGLRNLPSGFPEDLSEISRSQRQQVGRSLNNNYHLNDLTVLPDMKASVSFGKIFHIKGIKINNLTSLNYANAYQFRKISRHRYNEQDKESKVSPLVFQYNDDQIVRESGFNIINNWSAILSPRSTISLRNLFNQNGENTTTIRTGITPIERPNDEWKNYAFQYMQRSILSSQLSGKHEFEDDRTTYNWTLGYSYISRNEPDFRRFRTFRTIGSEGPYTLIDPPAATTFDAARFYSWLRENVAMNSGALEHVLGSKDSANAIKIRAGYYVENKSRNFEARWFSYVYRMTTDPAIKNQIITSPIDQIFSHENIRPEDGFELREGTNPSDAYEANNFNLAGYIGASVPWRKFNVSGGLRVEYNRLTLSKPIEVNNTQTLPLPSLNIGYNLSTKTIVRFAYAYTLNRPEFREIAPFVYYNFNLNNNFAGNPDLQIAKIHNVDLRYEIYPTPDQTITIGAFYKKFINPIEYFVSAVGLDQQFSLGNAAFANNYGIETEIRKSLGFLADNAIMERLSVLFNAAYIYSRVDMGDSPTLAQERTRALQGQSPYVINAGLYYNVPENGWSVSAMYNVFGRRIFFVGSDLFPTTYEMPRHVIDLTVIKELNENATFKFGISDLLNYPTRLVQDSDRDGKIGSHDDEVMSFRRGVLFQAGLSYKF